MLFTTNYKQGDIVLVSFPFTDLTSTKQRPALVVSPDYFNSAGQDLVLLAITSQLAADANVVRLGSGGFATGGLPKESVVKLTKIFTIHSSLILKTLASLKEAKLNEVLERLRLFFS
jgi:mRNA interferase MazF